MAGQSRTRAEFEQRWLWWVLTCVEAADVAVVFAVVGANVCGGCGGGYGGGCGGC